MTYVSIVQVDQFSSAVRRSSHGQTAVLVNGKAGDDIAVEASILRSDPVKGRGRLGVPDDQRHILGHSDNLLAIRCEHAARHGSGMAIEHVHESSRRNSPHPDRRIGGASQNDVALGVPVDPLFFGFGKREGNAMTTERRKRVSQNLRPVCFSFLLLLSSVQNQTVG